MRDKRDLALTLPDFWGNYWFGPPEDIHRPAILPFLTGPDKGKWYVSLGKYGMLWDRARLRVFASPPEALGELRKAIRRQA